MFSQLVFVLGSPVRFVWLWLSAFGFWGQFSSVSSHHFVWIVFTVAVEFRGMQIDFGEAGQLFKPASKLRALKSCTHTHKRTHTRKERERETETDT